MSETTTNSKPGDPIHYVSVVCPDCARLRADNDALARCVNDLREALAEAKKEPDILAEHKRIADAEIVGLTAALTATKLELTDNALKLGEARAEVERLRALLGHVWADNVHDRESRNSIRYGALAGDGLLGKVLTCVRKLDEAKHSNCCCDEPGNQAAAGDAYEALFAALRAIEIGG